MSSSMEFSAGRRSPPAEKTSFSQTCSFLSQYLKEKGGFGDLSIGMSPNILDRNNGDGTPEILRQPAAATMNFFPVVERPAPLRSMDLFPQQAGCGFAATLPKEDAQAQKGIDSSVNGSASMEPQSAQMTIFYAGQVIVFDNFPADKAKEVMLLASKGSQSQQTVVPAPPAKTQPIFAASNMAKPAIDSSSSASSSSNAANGFSNNLVQGRVQPPPSPAPAPAPAHPMACDLPIARRASLHRFLEKRKDRITARAPYQAIIPSTDPSKPAPAAENKPWLGLAAQSSQ